MRKEFMMNSRYSGFHWKWGGCVSDSLYTSSVLLPDAYRYDSPIGRPSCILCGIYSCILFQTIMLCGLAALFVSIPTKVQTRTRQGRNFWFPISDQEKPNPVVDF